MPVSKSIRFEIFARDAFTCQYCGLRPPDVVLEADHIHPVSRGGGDDMLNLITSCYACNRGKSAKVIAEIAPKPDADLMFLKAQQEIAEARRYLKAKRKRDALTNQVAEALEATWEQCITTSRRTDRPRFLAWIDKYGPAEVELAIKRSAAKAQSGQLGHSDSYYTTQKICAYITGILRSRAEEKEEPRHQ